MSCAGKVIRCPLKIQVNIKLPFSTEYYIIAKVGRMQSLLVLVIVICLFFGHAKSRLGAFLGFPVPLQAAGIGDALLAVAAANLFLQFSLF